MNNTEERKMIGPERAMWMKGMYVRKSDGNDYRRLKAEAEGSFTYVDNSLGIVEVKKAGFECEVCRGEIEVGGKCWECGDVR
jgi:hypothetical protein